MALFKFFHTPKPKGFNYKPIYFDPEQEEREKRMKKYSDAGNSSEVLGDRMRDGFARHREGKRSKTVIRSNIRLSVILIILLFLTYLMFFR